MTNHQIKHALQSLFEQGRDPMFITDKKGKIQHANPAFNKLYQYSDQEVIGQSLGVLLQNPLNIDSFQETFLEQLIQNESWSGELHVTSRNGEIIPAWTQITRVDDGFSAIQVDLRERDKITRKMESLSRMQSVSTLAGGVAHEFNNILAGIQGHLYLLKRQIPGLAEKDLDRFSRIEKLMHRAILLVQNLLAFSKQKAVVTREVNLVSLLEETMVMCEKAMDSGIKISLNLPERRIMVLADPIVFKQHVFELVMNAKAAVLRKRKVSEPYDEHIEITLKQSDSNNAEIVIRDNGGGMIDATLRHCLDPFFTTEPIGKGTGLGLSSAMAYIQQLGGALEVNSTWGLSTEIHMTLPLVSQTDGTSVSKGRILLVDDDSDLRQSLEEVLQYQGYEVFSAKDGQEALGFWREHAGAVDAVVMDIMMPKLNGVEVAKVIRHDNSDIPMCLTTGHADQEIPESLHANLIRKPLNPHLLLEFLERSLR